MDSLRAIKTGATIYLSGPMTGIPDHNYPTFNTWADRLRSRGFVVNNPAENGMAGRGWGECMRAAVKQLCDSDVVLLLPGWEGSKGARIEIDLAIDLGLPIHFASEVGL